MLEPNRGLKHSTSNVIAYVAFLHLQGVAGKMLHLKEALPSMNVSHLVAGCPALLLSYDMSVLEANLGKLRCASLAFCLSLIFPQACIMGQCAERSSGVQKYYAVLDCREAIGGRADVEKMIDREPMLLAADVGALLEEAQRLLPAGQDPAGFLAANPGILLNMQQAGLPSTIDKNFWTAEENV